MDGLLRATCTAALTVRACTWLRDEEAAGSNPATPTGNRQVTERIATCHCITRSRMSDFGSQLGAGNGQRMVPHGRTVGRTGRSHGCCYNFLCSFKGTPSARAGPDGLDVNAKSGMRQSKGK
jgi:hypothetical protein